MLRAFVTGLVLSALALSAQPAAAAEIRDTAMYDTVEAFEFEGSVLTVTGIVSGESTSTTWSFIIDWPGDAARCDRLLMLAMSKPGKFRFGVIHSDEFGARGCRLVART